MATKLSPSVRRKALRTFRQRGVVVHVGALECLFAAYHALPDLHFPRFLDRVFHLLGREDGAVDGILTLAVASSIAARLRRDEDRRDGCAVASIDVIDVFTVPSWQPLAAGASSPFGGKRVAAPRRPVIDADPAAKAHMFRARYDLMLGKTLRNDRFRPPAATMLAVSDNSPYFHLTGVESLAGSDGEKLVLGMLMQVEEGIWVLEDLNGVVRVDLSQASVTAGLHTECSFVIAQGRLVEMEGEEPCFQVSAMGTPPLEKRDDSLGVMSKNPNLFGGHLETSESAALLKMEKEAVDSVFLTLSDVALDNPKVMAGLRHLFDGYLQDDVVPKLVILMGNYLSHPFGQHVDDVMTLAEGFAELGTMIATDFEAIARDCMFVIIPGTSDPGPGNVLPRPPMPKIVMNGFIDAIGAERVHLGTNPCRIRYMTQEIVIMRDDLMQKMVRHCAVKPDFGESGLMSEHFVKSIVDQAYLSPLPNSARPVLWRHAHAMWLFPTPHAVIVADKVDSYICKYGGTLGLNPGSFATDFSFQVYIPAERRAQQCSLDSEAVLAGSEKAKAEVDDEDNVLEATHQEEDANMERSGGDASDGQLATAQDEAMGSGTEPDDEELPLPGQVMQEKRVESGSGEDGPATSSRKCKRTGAASGAEADKLVQLGELGRREGENERDDDELASSDDDSVLVPLDGTEKRDIKAFVRQATAVDESKPQTERDSNT